MYIFGEGGGEILAHRLEGSEIFVCALQGGGKSLAHAIFGNEPTPPPINFDRSLIMNNVLKNLSLVTNMVTLQVHLNIGRKSG